MFGFIFVFLFVCKYYVFEFGVEKIRKELNIREWESSFREKEEGFSGEGNELLGIKIESISPRRTNGN